METWIQALGLGAASAASPCVLPLYPGFIAYLSGNVGRFSGRRAAGLLGMVILAGVLSTMLIAGVALAALAIPVGGLLAYLVPFVDALLLALGGLLLLGHNPFSRLPGFAAPRAVGNPYAQAFLYGVILGPLALPCAGAYLTSLLAISVGPAEALPRVAQFLIFGLGFGSPLVILSLVGGLRRQAIVTWLVSHHESIQRAGGALLIVIAVLDAQRNAPNIRSTLGL